MRRETIIIITTVLALVATGVLMVYSSSAALSDSVGQLYRQLIFVLMGLIAMGIAIRFDYHRLKDKGIFRLIVFLSLLMLVLVLLPGFGRTVDGAQRWLYIFGFQFQPSELAKFGLILLLAVKISNNREHTPEFFRGFLPPMCIAALFAGLVVLQRDIGIPVLMMGTALVMVVVSGARWLWVGLFMVPMLGAGVMLILMFPHRMQRIIAFVDPWAYRDSSGWHLIQSLSAFAQGSWMGRGAGAGEQKLGYLPAAHTDFIYAVIGEEFGLVGTLLVLGLFALLVFNGLRVAAHAQDFFGSMLAVGIVSAIGSQALFIIAVTIGLLPTKGLPLPFISYGGTALVVFMAMSGVLVNIGAQALEPRAALRNRRHGPALA